MLEDLISGLSIIFQLEYIIFVFIGVFLGMIVGVLPGLSATMGVALLTPITFQLEATYAFGMLVGVYSGAFYGGGITACLLHTPGTPAAAATVLDGFPMVQKGKPERALGLVAYSSFFGGIFSTILLLFIAPILARFALNFGPPELFLLAIFGLTSIASIIF